MVAIHRNNSKDGDPPGRKPGETRARPLDSGSSISFRVKALPLLLDMDELMFLAYLSTLRRKEGMPTLEEERF